MGRQLIIIFLLCMGHLSFGGIKTFDLEYQVLTGRAVCWETCRGSQCEESDFAVFFDTKTFVALEKAKASGQLSQVLGGVDCESGSIPSVAEHMPKLQKEDPTASEKVLQSKGVEVEVLLYSNIFSEIDRFLSQPFAKKVSYQCAEQGLSTVLNFMNTNESEFFKENGEVFFCRSKTAPHKEILQWGDGSGLVGIEYRVENGKCVLSDGPYTGQDDGDLDLEWAQSYCQGFDEDLS